MRKKSMLMVMAAHVLWRSTNTKLFVSSSIILSGSLTRKMSSSAATASSTTTASIITYSSSTPTDLYILRHGQATHNPGAEAAREEGCSFDEFLRLMEQDDSLDSGLTELGRQQADSVRKRLLRLGLIDNARVDDHHESQQHQHSQKSSSSLSSSSLLFDLVVSSPLSRAIVTADLAVPHALAPNRILHESWREINGKLLNAQRRTVSELSTLFPHWDGSLIETEHDIAWKPDELETRESCRQRGYDGLHWILARPESKVLLVCHGGILNYTMNDLPEKVKVVDGRRTQQQQQQSQHQKEATKMTRTRASSARFSNCELRRYRMEWDIAMIPGEQSSSSHSELPDYNNKRIILTELDLEVEDI
jgi:broad specificity phosphatase PhoE